jgi:hypothetical protein
MPIGYHRDVCAASRTEAPSDLIRARFAAQTFAGKALYGRAITSKVSGEPILYSPNGFAGAARQALNKLGVKWEPTEAERAYNDGRSTQVPVNPAVRVKGRFSRQLRYRDTEFVLER